MGKNSHYKSPHSRRKHRYKLSSIDVNLSFDEFKQIFTVNMTPQEAFSVVSMPAFEGFISSMVPNYEPVSDELSEMSKE